MGPQLKEPWSRVPLCEVTLFVSGRCSHFHSKIKQSSTLIFPRKLTTYILLVFVHRIRLLLLKQIYLVGMTFALKDVKIREKTQLFWLLILS